MDILYIILKETLCRIRILYQQGLILKLKKKVSQIVFGIKILKFGY